MTRDQELINRVLARDPEAEATFVERHRGLVVGLARGRLGFDLEAAEELVQMTFARLWERDHHALRAWQGRGRFTTYLTIIVLRLGYQLNRGHIPVTATQADGPEDLQSTDDSPIESLDHRERHYAVQTALRRLSARDRLLLALRFFDERAPTDIARLLDRSPGAIRKGVHDALARLRQRLRIDSPDLFTDRDLAPRVAVHRLSSSLRAKLESDDT